jgi:hypothetical protein
MGYSGVRIDASGTEAPGGVPVTNDHRRREGAGPMPGEDLQTRDPQLAAVWVSVYRELSRVAEQLAAQGNPRIAVRLHEYRNRLRFWEHRWSDLSAGRV